MKLRLRSWAGLARSISPLRLAAGPHPGVRWGCMLMASWLGLWESNGATRTWTGGAGYASALGKWSIAANWSPVGRPQAGDALLFPQGVYNGTATNDLVGLSLSRITVQEDLWVRGNALTITGGITVASDAHVVFLCDVSWGGGVSAPIEIKTSPGRCEFYSQVDFNGRTLEVMGGKQTNDYAAAVEFAELGLVRGTGVVRIVADPAFPDPVKVNMAADLSGFVGKMLVERGQGAVGRNSGWAGQVVVGTAAGTPATFIFHDGALTSSSVVEVFPGAQVVSDGAQVGELKFHGGRLSGPLRVLGAMNQFADAEEVEIDGDVVLDQPVQTTAAAGMRVVGTLKPTLDAVSATLIKRGPGTLSLEGASDLKSAVRVEEGALRLTHRKGLGGTNAVTTVSAGATLIYELETQGTWDDDSQTVEEPLVLEGHAAVPALVGGEVMSFLGPMTLLGQVIVRAEGDVALSGPISGPGRLRGQARADGRILLRQGNKTYAGGTEMMSGLMELPSGLEIPSRNVSEGRLIVGTTSGEPAEVVVTDLGGYGESVAVEVRPTGKLTCIGAADPASLRLSAGGVVRAGERGLKVADAKLTMAPVPAGTAVLTGTLIIENLSGDSFTIDLSGLDTVLRLNGSVLNQDPGAPVTLVKSGLGSLVLAGSLPNDVYGDCRVEGGRLVLEKSGGLAWRRGQILVGLLPQANAALELLGYQQLHPDVAVMIGGGGKLELPGPRVKPESIGALAGKGLVELAAGSILQVGANGDSSEFEGILHGEGGLTKVGAGTFRLTGTNECAGLTRVTGGTLVVDGLCRASELWVTNGASLAGTGVVQKVTVTAGSLLTPGRSAGRLSTGDLELLAGSRLRMELNGSGPGTGFDQLSVAGVANLSGAILDLVPGFLPELGATFRLIDNDGTDLIQGAFQNLPEGANITNGPAVYRLTYVAGNRNNDAVLEVLRLESGANNRAPVVIPPGDKTVMEGTTLAFAVAASDPDGDTLTWELVGVVPVGVSLNPGTGLFAWTPTEAQGPGTYAISVRVSDSANPSASTTTTFNVTVTEENTPPQIQPLGDYEIREGELLDVKILAADSDLPAQHLSFSPRGAWPEGAVLNPGTGRLRWTPTEAQGPSTHVLDIDVTDDGVPARTSTTSLKIVVAERNQAPTLTVPADALVAEGVMFRATAQAADTDLPRQRLTFSWAGAAPAGMTLVPETGEISWQPDETQGPSTNVVKIRVTDDGVPSRSATAAFSIVVTEKNEAPRLKPVADQVIPAESGLVLALSASDVDLPVQKLTFSFEGDKPLGMNLDVRSGQITWQPGAQQRPSHHVITVKVTDDGDPSRSAVRSFQVQALAPTEVSAPVLDFERVAESSLRLSWDSVSGVTYRLERSVDLQAGSWQLMEELVATENRTARTVGMGGSFRYYRLVVP